jgi:hypothetical protein
MKRYVRWIALVCGIVLGVFLLLSGLANAWLSATPVEDPERFKGVAMGAFLLGIATIAGGIVGFVMLKPKKARQRGA